MRRLTYAGDDLAARVHFIEHGRGVRGQTVELLVQIRLADRQQSDVPTTFNYTNDFPDCLQPSKTR